MATIITAVILQKPIDKYDLILANIIYNGLVYSHLLHITLIEPDLHGASSIRFDMISIMKIITNGLIEY